MEILIKTGFQKVSHNLFLQPETVPKGIKLFKAEHVQRVVERRKDGISCEIEGRVIKQMKVTDEPYHTKLIVRRIQYTI